MYGSRLAHLKPSAAVGFWFHFEVPQGARIQDPHSSLRNKASSATGIVGASIPCTRMRRQHDRIFGMRYSARLESEPAVFSSEASANHPAILGAVDLSFRITLAVGTPPQGRSLSVHAELQDMSANFASFVIAFLGSLLFLSAMGHPTDSLPAPRDKLNTVNNMTITACADPTIDIGGSRLQLIAVLCQPNAKPGIFKNAPLSMSIMTVCIQTQSLFEVLRIRPVRLGTPFHEAAPLYFRCRPSFDDLTSQ
ncbi:hypothetical protein C8R47DRAFT_1093020 [Mycena vitilis]|nr:hypothetical protein C8R47DRAFT_1093020 [Mycena vitilis]